MDYRIVVSAVFLVTAVATPGRAQQSGPSPTRPTPAPTYEVRGLPAGWTRSELIAQDVVWDDFGDRYTWADGKSLLVLTRGASAPSLACPDVTVAPAGTRAALAEFRTAVAQKRVSVGGRSLRYLNPTVRSTAKDFLDLVADNPNRRWKPTAKAAALLDCDGHKTLIGTGRFSSPTELRRRWSDPSDRGRLLLIDYEAPSSPTIYPSQRFIGPGGTTLLVELTLDPRSTAGIAFGAPNTVRVGSVDARADSAEVSFSLCRGIRVGLSGGMTNAELAVLASGVSVALKPSAVPSLDFPQNSQVCSLWNPPSG